MRPIPLVLTTMTVMQAEQKMAARSKLVGSLLAAVLLGCHVAADSTILMEEVRSHSSFVPTQIMFSLSVFLVLFRAITTSNEHKT
jgi:hypothetical protein